MARSKKSQYTVKADRVIYLLLSPLSKDFFISHCQKSLIIDVFKHHYYGKRYKTEASIETLKKKELHPCLFILETVNATKVEAYNYVIVWTKIFSEAGYTSLDKGNVLCYAEDLYENNLLLYNKRKPTIIEDYLKCSNCLVSNYGRRQCRLYKGEENDGK